MGGLGFGMSLKMSHQLSLRQSLEQTLELSLRIVPTLRLSLELQRERENFCTKLYRKALKRGDVFLYKKHGMEFEFALISKRELPEWVSLECGHAFSQCLMRGYDFLVGGGQYAKAQGSWLLFVIKDLYPDMPQKAIEYAAVHERGEMVTLGQHHLASKLEFAIAQKEEKLRWYIDWIEKNCPSKFADVFNYQVHVAIPESEECQKILEIFQTSQEATLVRQMIEKFEWPYSILQKLSQYKKANEALIKILGKTFRIANIYATEKAFSILQMVTKIKEVIGASLQEARQKGLLKFASPAGMDKYWHTQRIELDNLFSVELQLRKKVMDNQEFNDQVIAAEIESSLPNKGVLSLNFSAALKHL